VIRVHTARDGTKTYGVRVSVGGKRQWLGSFPTRRLAQEAEAEALLSKKRREAPTVDALGAAYLEVYGRRNKASSLRTARDSLRGFRDDFGPRPIDSIDRTEAEAWARQNGWQVRVVRTLFNYGVEHYGLERNVFAGLAPKSEGRKHLDPLTEEEVERLAQCSHAHGWYAPVMAAFIRFGAYTGRRPGELYALEWRDLDIPNRRGMLRRRVYRGDLDLPKDNKPHPFALFPQAVEALEGLPRTSSLVFPAKEGGMLSSSLMSTHYLPPMWALFGKRVTPHELRHFCAHYLYVKRNLPSRVVAQQLGHCSPSMVEDLYSHWRVDALDELDRAFGQNVVPLKDAGGAHGA
jgi:integrase